MLLAQLVRPQGRAGEIVAESETDFPERLVGREQLFVRVARAAGDFGAEPEAVALTGCRPHGGRLVLKFAGIDSIAEAERYRGADLVTPLAARLPLEAGEVYFADLVGCKLVDRRTGEVVGTVVGVDRESSNLDLLVVCPAAGGEALVPLALAYQPVFRLQEREVEMSLPEGLLTVDESRE